jgi:hypothetical protein
MSHSLSAVSVVKLAFNGFRAGARFCSFLAHIEAYSLQFSKNDACTLLQAGVLSFGADSFTLLILKLLLMF